MVTFLKLVVPTLLKEYTSAVMEALLLDYRFPVGAHMHIYSNHTLVTIIGMKTNTPASGLQKAWKKGLKST